MPSYKLHYFNARGWGEMCRLMFAQQGQKYDDVRYTSETWPEHKSKMLFGQMPVLEVDGEQIAHSRAALRYLAREFKLDGGNSLTAAKIDMWIEVLVEAFSKLPFGEKDEAKKAELMAKALENDVVPRLNKLEAALRESNGPFLFGKNVTAADIGIYAMMSALKGYLQDSFPKNIPKVEALLKEVENLPKIKEWIAKRPQTDN